MCLWAASAQCRVWGKTGNEGEVERQPLLEQLAALTGQHLSGLDGAQQVTGYEPRETEGSAALMGAHSQILPKYLTHHRL